MIAGIIRLWRSYYFFNYFFLFFKNIFVYFVIFFSMYAGLIVRTIVHFEISHRLVLYSVKLRRGCTLGQRGRLPSPKPEPCPQMFWLQQQYAVYRGRSLAFKMRFWPGLCPAPRWGSLRRSPRSSSRTTPLGSFCASVLFAHRFSRFWR